MTDPPGNATTRPVALVTGCTDGSIGSALALSYLRRGYRVLATLRDPSKASCLAGLPNLHTIALDVTNSLSLTDTAHTIQSDFEGRLDVLVNNAGVGYTTPLLDATLDEARHVFEVNFWACVATVQAFAPFLLRVSGTVVNMSSVGSRLPTTWTGFYGASKAALSHFSETLRLEVEPLGVTVITVEVGIVQSNFHATNAARSAPPLPESSLYRPVAGHIWELARGQKQPPQQQSNDFAENLVRTVLARGKRGGRVWVGAWAGTIGFVSAYAPAWFTNIVMRYWSGLYALRAQSPNHALQ